MRYLIVRTDIRPVEAGAMESVWADGKSVRDERTTPEPRRQTVLAQDRAAALDLARALSAMGSVRSGRQRVKIIRVGDPKAWQARDLHPLPDTPHPPRASI
ncbi:hypothetical protein [Catenuloplanes atrovinosus]|uniref:Uncharacterized protein n=1 Tax=Catenuloplanes atrovinosus TaxID=137266 RepID=A0AAE3YY70_9ACTN|nr:hypothetical protein [Catenuloplanes atrovinosus]MDR7280877.1 hypothetical protein [Catenuloplanes atrovinosus]